MCAPLILAAYSSFIAAMTVGSPSTLMACASSRKMKWIEKTPDSGCAVEALAVDSMTKSISPVCTFCMVCASVPSWALGYWLIDSVPLLSSVSFLSKISAPTP